MREPGAPRSTRRLALSAAGAALLASHRPAGASDVTQGTPLWKPFPADAKPFDGAGRRAMATMALDVVRSHSGLAPGRGVYYLPAAPVLGSGESPRRQWFLTLPGGTLIYLIVFADVLRRVDPGKTTIRINGAPLGDLSDYIYFGVRALTEGRVQSHAIMDLVFPPPPPGTYRIQVVGEETAYAVDYELTIEPPDAYGPMVLRDWLGKTFAVDGPIRRHIPDAETVRLLGYREEHMLNVERGALDAIPEGSAVERLTEGLVRDPGSGAVLRLASGTRRWVPPAELAQLTAPAETGQPPEIRSIDVRSFQTIPPALAPNTLVKASAPDVFVLENGALRRVPSPDWLAQRRDQLSDVFYAPRRVLDALPQAAIAGEPGGVTWQERSFRSAALNATVPYRVYLPFGYHQTPAGGEAAPPGERPYPVIYLLHGSGGTYEEWSRFGLEAAAGAAMSDPRSTGAIIVLLHGGRGYWVNQPDGTRWADYVVKDAVAHIDATYRTVAERRGRAVGGYSMGGHGALQLALNSPGTFGVVGAHSPSIHRREAAPALFGNEADFAQRDPLALAKQVRREDAPQLWIDIGAGDEWRANTEELHRELEQRGWAHEWRTFGGSHGVEYWAAHMAEYLAFYLTAFAKSGL